MPTIEDVKDAQRRLDLLDTHVLYVGEEQFVLAHTDEERASIDLETCELHIWLHGLPGPPVAPGYYAARPHEPDAYSEPYCAEPWDLEPLGWAIYTERQSGV